MAFFELALAGLFLASGLFLIFDLRARHRARAAREERERSAREIAAKLPPVEVTVDEHPTLAPTSADDEDTLDDETRVYKPGRGG
jgi:hypothetical protein